MEIKYINNNEREYCEYNYEGDSSEEESTSEVSSYPDSDNITDDEESDIDFNIQQEQKEEVDIFTLREFKDISSFNLYANQYITLPSSIKYLTNLTKINITECYIEYLPSEICLLNRLLYINVLYSRLEQLPSQIGQLTNLTTLKLFDTKIQYLPSEMVYLSNLKILKIGANKLNGFPKIITKLTSLKRLDLQQNNRINVVPPTICNLKQLKSLNLYSCNIVLFNEISQLTNLKSLDLSHNFIRNLPNGLDHLKKLKKFNISNNQVLEFPKDLCNLSKLKYIDVGDNLISELPLELLNLKKLTQFSCSRNKINDFPSKFQPIVRRCFRETNCGFYCGDNNIHSVPYFEYDSIYLIHNPFFSKEEIDERNNTVVIHPSSLLDFCISKLYNISDGKLKSFIPESILEQFINQMKHCQSCGFITTTRLYNFLFESYINNCKREGEKDRYVAEISLCCHCLTRKLYLT